MAAVFTGRVRWLAFAERPVYRLLGVDPDAGQSWQRYSVSTPTARIRSRTRPG